MKTIPIIDIDVSLPPDKRWQHLPAPLRQAGRALASRAAAELGDVRLQRLAEWLLDAATVARNPYRAEIAALARRIGIPRRTALAANMSYEINQIATLGLDAWENSASRVARLLGGVRSLRSSTAAAITTRARRIFGCTAGAAYSPKLGMIHVRTLDWDLPGLGRHSVIWRCRGAEAGEYYSIGWPGYVGVLSAMAPGRFSATINHASPFGMPSLQFPPAHLLRWIFEHCADFEDALVTLHATPVCLPAFVTLVGSEPGQAAVVELTPKQNRVHRMSRLRPIAIANDYLSGEWRAGFGLGERNVQPHEKGERSEHRRNQMLAQLNRRKPGSIERALSAVRTEWIDNESTVQQMVLIPASGECLVFGLVDQEPVAIGAVNHKV